MKTNQQKYLILIGFCLLIIAHHFIGYLGHYGYDDMHYARLAHDLNLGKFNPQDHFSFRITLLGLTALSYRLLGVNDLASSLPSILVSIGTLVLVFMVLKKKKPAVIAIGLSLFSLNLWGLFYSDKLMPDSFVTFFVFLCIFIIYAFKFRERIFSVLTYAFAAALALFLGFNTKGNIILVLPLLAYLFITDLILKRDIKFWIAFSGSSLLLLFLYFIFYQAWYGSALVRFQAMAENSYLNLCSYSEQPFMVTLKRIGYQFLLLGIDHALFTPFLFLLATPKQFFKKETFQFNSETGFFILSAFILLLSSNFMTISASGYSPMCLDPRHYLFIIPVAGIAAALRIKQNLNNKAFVIQVIIFTTVAFLLTFFFKNNISWLLYFPLILGLFLILVLRKDRFRSEFFAVLLFVALLINPVQMAHYAKNVNFKEQEKIFKETVLTLDPPALVLTSQVQKNVAQYLNGFKTSEIEILSYNEFNDPSDIADKPIYLFKNYYTRYLSGMTEAQLPFYARLTDNYTKLFEDSKLDIQLFKIDTLSISKEILETHNDFEGVNPEWSNYRENDKYVYSGSYSSLLEKYSSTFRFKLDTLSAGNARQLIISASFRVLQMKDSEVSFVISTDSGFWKGTGFKNQIKAYGNWMPVTVTNVIDLNTIPPNAIFSLYLLNDKEEETYLDDFSISISVLEPIQTE